MTSKEALKLQDTLFMTGYVMDLEATTFTRIVYKSKRGDANQVIETFDKGQSYYLNPDESGVEEVEEVANQVPEESGTQLSLF